MAHIQLSKGREAANILSGVVDVVVGKKYVWFIREVDPLLAPYFASRSPKLAGLDLRPALFVFADGNWRLLQMGYNLPAGDTPGIDGRTWCTGLIAYDNFELL